MRFDLLVENAVNQNFLRIPQSTFPMLQSTVQMESSRYSTQVITMTSFKIDKISFKYLFFKRQKKGLIYWSKMLLITIFCGFRKLRFQCYSRQFKRNQVVIVLKRSR